MTTSRKKKALKNRWRCPECGGTKVEIGLPAWFIERDDFSLKQTGIDEGADVMWWYCPECDASENGQPEENT